MVAAELGVDTLERGVTLGLRLLDTVVEGDISGLFWYCVVRVSPRKGRSVLNAGVGLGSSPRIPQHPISNIIAPSFSQSRNQRKIYAPVTVSLLAVVVLGRVLGLCRSQNVSDRCCIFCEELA